MAELKQRWYMVDGYGTSGWPNDIFSNILDGDRTSKISIQAPPGTVASLNSKKILIGPSGIYDFDYEGIVITDLSFPQQSDRGSTIKLLKDYINSLNEALSDLLIPDNQQEPVSPATEISTNLNPIYGRFCNGLQGLLSTGVSCSSSSELKTLGTIVSEYLAIQNDIVSGNTSLRNIIVSYITN